jgi:ABC-2 type transport system ATP-binding protein
MGATVIEITMRDDAASTRAAGTLAPVGGTSREGKLVRVSVPGGEGPRAMLNAVRLLDGEHLDPAAIVLREPTLDDVFLELTGRTTVDGDGGDES